MVNTPFRVLMLLLWILSLSLLLVFADDLAADDRTEEFTPSNAAEEQNRGVSGKDLALFIPMILTTIALAYTFKEHIDVFL